MLIEILSKPIQATSTSWFLDWLGANAGLIRFTRILKISNLLSMLFSLSLNEMGPVAKEYVCVKIRSFSDKERHASMSYRSL
jgi:hypothetical protein